MVSIVQPDSASLQAAEEHLAAGRVELAEALCLSQLQSGLRAPRLLILLSFVRMKQERWDEAELLLRGGSTLHPTHVGLHATLGGLYTLRKRFAEAVDPLQTCVLLEPGRRDHRVALIAVYETRVFTTFSHDAKRAMLACLADDALTHSLMSQAWLSLLRLDPESAALLTLFTLPSYAAFSSAITIEHLVRWRDNDFFNDGSKRFVIADPIIERGLTFTRRWFLEGWRNGQAAVLAPHLALLCKLACVCFLTEYVFAAPEDPAALAASLGTPAEVALFGCYEPLFRYERSRGLASLSDEACYRDLVRVQIEEPLKEARIKARIPVWASIEDQGSMAVRDQYEHNPYPRWATVGGAVIPENVASAAKGKAILVAGCGTGREAVDAALIFPAARVEAFDLSRTSLAYGIRKAREMGVRNLTFTQGDLLNVGHLRKAFDLIICSGVLHHLESPQAGLGALLEVLAPGGMLKLALYSTIARRTISDTRASIANAGFQPTNQGIRDFRASIFARGDDDPVKKQLTAWQDFYSMSQCRDLIFPVRERTFTLLEISDMARDFGLSVLEVVPKRFAHRASYHDRFPEDSAATTLTKWHLLELEKPTIFAGMYCIWFCRTRDERTIDATWVRKTNRM
jgi:ubiquinone/menaquinone biosynthesis C-methylase UbiE